MMPDDARRESIRNMRSRTTRLDREGDYWQPYEIERLRAEFDAGTGVTEIALMLQRTEPAIMQQIEKLDLFARKKNPRRIHAKLKELTCRCFKCSRNPLCNGEYCMQEVEHGV